jgi:hypothetical protein
MRHRLNVSVLAALLALAAGASTAGAAICGDAACQTGGGPACAGGVRDIGDVGALLTCVVNAATCTARCGGAGAADCADMNQDGAVNISDAVILLNDVLAKPNILPICTSAGPTVPCGTVISADIDSNRVLASCEYFLDGLIFVDPGVVLTIQAGATIKGRKVSSDGSPSSLIFQRAVNCDGVESTFSARINANGTPSAPIVFTSDQPVGSRAAGDWGGVAFLGCSQVNFPTGEGEPEGLPGATFGHGPQGGLTPLLTESSGLARYVRAEFAGRQLVVDNELNVWTMNALGSGTQFDHIQAHKGLDDGFEWFGGTNKMKYLVSTANSDDNFDWQIGAAPKVQYGLVAHHAPSLETAGSHGYEADNNEDGFSELPFSNPQFCNVTLIGSLGQSGYNLSSSYAGIFMRRGTAGQLAKHIVMNMGETGLQLRDPETAEHACSGDCLVGGVARTNGTSACDGAPGNFSIASFGDVAPDLVVQSSVFHNNGVGNCSVTTATKCQFDTDCPGVETCVNEGTIHCKNRSGGNNTGDECNSCEYYNLLLNASLVTEADPGINPAWPPTDPRPTNATNVADALDCGVEFGDPFFETTDYVGAFEPNGTNWLDTPGGWISFATQ